MDIKSQIELLIEKLDQNFEMETTERKEAREKVLKKINDALGEFKTLSQKIGTTSEQLSAISQLRKVILELGNFKNPEK